MTMKEIIQLLNEFRSESHTPKVLMVWLFVAVFAFVFVDGFLRGYFPSEFIFLFYKLVLVLIMSGWLWWRHYFPRRKKDRIGIVIAIASDSPEISNLKDDLVAKLSKNFENAKLSEMIDIIVLPNHHATEIKQKGDIDRFNKKVDGHFWVIGKARNRGGKTYLDLDGYVIHSPVGVKTKNIISRDFRSALPVRIEFSNNLTFQFSELTADHIYFTARFITSMAALVSGDPEVALTLLKALDIEISAPPAVPPNLAFIRSKIPILVSDSHITIAQYELTKGNTNRAKEELTASFVTNPKSYAAWVFRSLIEFSIDNNPREALLSTRRAEFLGGYDSTWKYNKTFLLLWQSNYLDALKMCKHLSRHSFDGEENTLREVFEFNEALIKNGTAKPEIYFWLGFLHYKKKNNIPQALYYLEEFEKQADGTMKSLVDVAKGYLVEIRQQIGITE